MILCLLIYPYNADAGFFEQKSRGWHWYEDGRKEIEGKDIAPTDQVEEIRRDVEAKLHTALITPTEDNVVNYIKAQRAIEDRSEKFANVWQRVVYTNPQLDITTKYPVSSNALQIFRADELVKKREKIKRISREYGLMFFFRGDCAYCKGFTPVVLEFAAKYNWYLMPVQIGDVPLEEIKDAKQDNSIAATLGILHVPALVAVHPKTKRVIPLAYGYISDGEIEDRVNVLLGDDG